MADLSPRLTRRRSHREAEEYLSRSLSTSATLGPGANSYEASVIAPGSVARDVQMLQEEGLITRPSSSNGGATTEAETRDDFNSADLFRRRDSRTRKDVRSRASPSRKASQSNLSRSLQRNWVPFRRKPSSTVDEEENGSAQETEPAGKDVEPTETSALLGDSSDGAVTSSLPENVAKQWSEADDDSEMQTTWKRETKIIIGYTLPLLLTFLLQNSLTLTSVFTVGHIGTNELGAVSLGGMTASITGYAVYQGLATALDTLCAQAYGSGQKKLVGLQVQRMIWCLWVVTIPIAILWGFGTHIIAAIVPERDIAEMAGKYLQVLIIGAPGYAAFEAGKRFVQAQGLFHITLYVLLVCAPLNVFLQWFFVWRLEWGFIGCPIAIVIVETLMPILLLFYVRVVDGMQCWPGFTFKAFRNWSPMIRLAVPGLLMILAEFLAFEILTLASARISPVHLAANTVLQSASVLTFQAPWTLSIAASTRVAFYIGGGYSDAARLATRVAFALSIIVGVFNLVILSSLRMYIPWLFTSEADVVELAAATFPVNAAFQLFDAFATECNGLLRSLGKQAFGGYVNLFAYYVVSFHGSVCSV